MSETAAFTRSIGGLGPLYAAWTELRDLVQGTIAVQSRENLLAAGTALTQIAESFADTDELNAQLVEYAAELDSPLSTDPETGEITGTPEYERPPYVPDAPGPDDPHPETEPLPDGMI